MKDPSRWGEFVDRRACREDARIGRCTCGSWVYLDRLCGCCGRRMRPADLVALGASENDGTAPRKGAQTPGDGSCYLDESEAGRMTVSVGQARALAPPLEVA